MREQARRSKCVSFMLNCAFAVRLSIQMHARYVQVRSRLTPVDPNVFPSCSIVLSSDACRSKCMFGMFKYVLGASLSKCISYMFNCFLVRRLPILMRFRYPKMHSRPTAVDPHGMHWLGLAEAPQLLLKANEQLDLRAYVSFMCSQHVDL